MSLSEQIQALRKRENHSQEELAHMLNISRQAVSKWESGLVQPELDNIIKLAKLYNVSTDYLLMGEESFAEEPKAEPSFKISSETTNTIVLIAACSGIAFAFIAMLYWLTL